MFFFKKFNEAINIHNIYIFIVFNIYIRKTKSYEKNINFLELNAFNT